MTRRPADLDVDERRLLDDLATRVERKRRAAGPCPAPDWLRAAESGALTGTTAVDILSHLDVCEACQVLVEALTDEDVTAIDDDERARLDARVLGAARAGNQLRPPAQRRWPRPVVSAMALAASALLAVWTAPVWLNPAPPPPAGPPDGPATVPVSPPSVLALGLPRVEVAIEEELVSRGAPGASTQAESDPRLPAIDAFDRRDFEAAARLLGDAARHEPSAADLRLLLGVSLLYLDRPSDALRQLTVARNTGPGPIRQEATWYLALANAHTGQTGAASSLLEPLCGSPTERSLMACLAIDELSRASQHR